MRRVRRELPAADAEDFSVIENENRVYRATGNQPFLKVSIFSPDPMIRTFLQGILAFQGYQSEVDIGIQGFLSEMVPTPGRLVFLDGAYLTGIESDAIGHRVQELVQGGVKCLVLAEQRWSVALALKLSGKGAQILWKPLDYRQVSEVMVPIGFELR